MQRWGIEIDETVALYASKIVGDPSYLGLVNNKHPLIPLSTLQAGYRLLLHGLAAECLHAALVQMKRQRAAPEMRVRDCEEHTAGSSPLWPMPGSKNTRGIATDIHSPVD